MIRRFLYRYFQYFYDLALIFAFILSLPKLIYKMIVYGKYKRSIGVRFGIKKIEVPGCGPLVWFHGASVGEVRLLYPVIERFVEEYPHWRAMITACTEAGVKQAEQLYSSLGLVVSVLPLDFSLIIKPLVRRLSPSLMVFSEGDCWLNLVEEAKCIGASIIVINGRISADSSRGFKFLKRLGKNYFSPVDMFLLQDEVYKQRFLSLGVAEEKIQITGNIKTYLGKPSSGNLSRSYWRKRLGLSAEDKLIVLGSTHKSDEEKWLPIMEKFFQNNIRVLWVPRHIEKTKDLEERFRKRNILYGLWSQNTSFQDASVVIVDEIGLLKQLYVAGDVAFVGGTFDPKIGGHNLLEPLQSKVPLLFGPCLTSQSELAERLLAANVGICLDGSKPIADQVLFLLNHPEERKALIQKGIDFLIEEEVSFERAWQALKSFIPLCKNTQV
ncbi:lipid IV(A) 3-deoxy-D-manno-octulosonic acid transferase [Chlamydia sp. 17-3921]|uniref:lipid IV(A) 3-deoxy-D-manno-octulosonic acid transferase n=1 Tax=Chlamydia sp. 17-3921 TaxID=2675798 RepID=UPI001917BA2B|nr:lipid IV(A) 3-deoxy-D-manno-octulosonic acid transferase [Chlamydia sp. 17-3921]